MAETLKISLAAARVNAGLTQEDVAKKMHVAKNTVLFWEKGKTKIKPAQLEMYCRICGISTDFIFLQYELT